MKKLFFLRPFSSSSGNSSQVSPPSTEKQVYWEKPLDGSDKFRTRKQESENPCLRRSLSFSSGAVYDYGGMGQRNLNDRSDSPCGSSNASLKHSGRHSSRRRTLTPERERKAKKIEEAPVFNSKRGDKPTCVASSSTQCDSSESSSYCSTNASSKILDRYIDGEQQQQERSSSNRIFSASNHTANGKRPPRVQYTGPSSPTDGRKQKPKSQSFRETKGTQFRFQSKGWAENGFGHESPRKLARHVVERLSQSRVLPSSEEHDPDIPITIEDIYGGSVDKCGTNVYCEGVPQKTHKEKLVFTERKCLFDDNEAENDDSDVELLRRSKEAEEQAKYLLEELEQENFLQDSGFNLPYLIQTIRNLSEDGVNMALEISTVLQDRISERASARADLDARTRRLEKEKNELQSALEKELDRRSSEWSLKLEKYQSEENRLRERVRELAEQNVSLQRDVSSLSEREMDSRSVISYSELQLKDLTAKMDEATDENQRLQKNLSELQEKYSAAAEDRDCIRRNYKEKERESKELHRSITRLLKTCSEQEKTIDGLCGLAEEVRKKVSSENFDTRLGKFQMEQLRLTGVEQALRKEVESYRHEVDFLRQENINLLHRLKSVGKEGGFSTFKLDQELVNRVGCLQNQGILLFTESTQLCTKLLEHIKAKAGHTSETKQGIEVVNNGMDGQFVVESDVKLQGLKRGIGNLTRSLETVSAVLHEKSHLGALESESHGLGGGSGELNNQRSEELLQSELKAETLLTSLLREKLYTKEQEVEQLRAELAAVVRGNDILRSEVQNALDTVSCITHKMKDLEIQMIKKEEIVNRLQNDLQECSKELTIVRGILPKVSSERDMMWEEVKKYSENNMLLNSEINVMKKKIEVLDEDVLLKEGQITILKDALGRPFDLLGSPDSAQDFLLK